MDVTGAPIHFVYQCGDFLLFLPWLSFGAKLNLLARWGKTVAAWRLRSSAECWWPATGSANLKNGAVEFPT